MAFIGGKTLLFALVALTVFKTARSVLDEWKAGGGDYEISADSFADRGVETDSEMEFGEVHDGRQKTGESYRVANSFVGDWLFHAHGRFVFLHHRTI